MSESSMSPRKVVAAERLSKALEMRKAGATYSLIAVQLGYANESGAFKAVKRAVEALNAKIGEDVSDVKRLELERLDRLMVTLWPKATQGQLGAIDRVLKIMERRAKLMGLDAATQEEHKISATIQAADKPMTPEEAQAFLDKTLGSRHSVH